jgi:hypothetical protein
MIEPVLRVNAAMSQRGFAVNRAAVVITNVQSSAFTGARVRGNERQLNFVSFYE